MGEIEEFVDTDRRINYNLYMDIVQRMRSVSRNVDDIQEKINAMRIFDLRLRARPASPNDKDLYIEKMEELSDQINALTDEDYMAKLDGILFRMLGVMEIFIEQAKVFRNEGKQTVTGKPITREGMMKERP